MADDGGLNLGEKKKKKKKKPAADAVRPLHKRASCSTQAVQAQLLSPLQEDALAEATGAAEEPEADGDEAGDAAPLDLGLGKKKKKKKAKAGPCALLKAAPTKCADHRPWLAGQARTDDDFSLDTEDAPEGEPEAEDAATNGNGLPWDGSDRDYIYEELLGVCSLLHTEIARGTQTLKQLRYADRVFGILKENNPELTGEKRRTVVKPPQVLLLILLLSCSACVCTGCSQLTVCLQVAREGTKKTVFTNYMELCKAMNRQPEHVQLYLMAELGTSGNLDGQMRLVVKGRFQPKAFEGVLRRYANECAPALT